MPAGIIGRCCERSAGCSCGFKRPLVRPASDKTKTSASGEAEENPHPPSPSAGKPAERLSAEPEEQQSGSGARKARPGRAALATTGYARLAVNPRNWARPVPLCGGDPIERPPVRPASDKTKTSASGEAEENPHPPSPSAGKPAERLSAEPEEQQSGSGARKARPGRAALATTGYARLAVNPRNWARPVPLCGGDPIERPPVRPASDKTKTSASGEAEVLVVRPTGVEPAAFRVGV